MSAVSNEMTISPAIEVGSRLVSLFNAGQAMDFIDRCYAPGVVSIEGPGDDGEPRTEGFAAVSGKSEWWYANHEVHSAIAEGPFVGHRSDQFVVRYELDVTPVAGERMQMTEVGLYTIEDGKIALEEFLYRVD